MGSTDEGAATEESGDGRDPLLVRPFLLQEGEPVEESPSAATWPADPAREIPTQVIPVVPATTGAGARRPRRRRRPLLLAGAGIAAVLAVVGWAVIRPALQPTVSTSLPQQQLPAITGPAPTASVLPSGDAAGGDADNSGGDTSGDSDGGTTKPSRTATRSSASARATTPAPGKTTPAAPAPPAELAPSLLETGPKALVSGNGLCLDLRGGDVQEGADLHVDDCNGSSPQLWQLKTDRTLEVGDLCAYLEGNSEVELARCDGRTTAQWTLNDDGRLTNATNGRCLTDPNFGARPGNAVVVTFCAGTPNQRWTFR